MHAYRLSHRSFAVSALLLAGACTGKHGDVARSDSAADSAADSGFTPPCSGGAWGDIDPAVVATALHVSAGAAAGGDGSEALPFQSIDDAVTASRADGATKVIVIWPGSYPSSLDLGSLHGDDGLQLEGCSAGEVSLTGSDASLPILKISGGSGLGVRGLTLAGGHRGLWVWEGASVTVDDVHAASNAVLGVVIDGAGTQATMTNLVISDPSASSGFGGYGLAVRNAVVSATNVTVSGATEEGILVDGDTASISLSTVAVTNTAARGSDGEYGRGITIQNLASASITDGTFTGNHDAGIFGLGAALLDILRAQVDGTLPSSLPASEDTSGDGIVASDRPEGEPYATTYFSSSIQDVSVSGSSRAGVLLSGDGLGVSLAGTNPIAASTSDPSAGSAADGGGLPLVQAGARVSGGDVFAMSTPLAIQSVAAALDGLSP